MLNWFKKPGGFFLNRSAGSADEEFFTIIMMPDTQKHVDNTSPDMDPLYAETNWIIANKSALNIKMVLHSGDLVEYFNVQSEWNLISAEMEKIRTAGIPYAVVTGNHDYDTTLGYRNSAELNTNFPLSRFSGENYYVESFNGQSENTLWSIESGDLKLLIISHEMGPSRLVRNWIRDRCWKFSDHVVLVSSHAYLRVNPTTGVSEVIPDGESGDTGGYGLGDYINCEDMRDLLYNTIENIRIVRCAHRGTSTDRAATVTGTGDNSESKHQTMLNDQYWGVRSETGHLGIMTFYPKTDTIECSSYSPYTDSEDVTVDAKFTITDIPLDGTHMTQPTYPVTGIVELEQYIDAVEQQTVSGTMFTAPSDIEMGYDGATQQHCGFRFSLPIPRTSTINYAFIRFTADEPETSACSLTIAIEDSSDAAEFTSTDFDVSGRTELDTVSWPNIPVWDTDEEHDTVDLSSLVQQVVNKSSYNWGNYISFIIYGTGTRTSRPGTAGAGVAPRLHYSWSPTPA